MKRLICCFALLMSTLLSTAAVIRTASLEADSFNGCYMDKGVLRLHRELPTQTGENDLVIASATPLSIFFQEDVFARKAGARSDELVQIKKSAAEYTPQYDDPECACGYVDYTKLAVYQCHLVAAGPYALWFRVWAPSVANWQFDVQVDKGEKHEIALRPHIPAPKQWFWIKGPVLNLSAGNHQIEIINALNGKRIGQMLLTRNLEKTPGGDIAVTPSQIIHQGTVTFRTLAPFGLLSWQRMECQCDSPQNILVEHSADGGKSFVPLKEDALENHGKRPLTLRMTLTRRGTQEPSVSGLRVTYLCDAAQFATIQAGDTIYSFSRKNGALAGVVNHRTGTVIQAEGHDGMLFSLLLKAQGKTARRYLDMTQAHFDGITSGARGALQLSWSFPKDAIQVKIELRPNGKMLCWNITVDNKNRHEDVIEVEAPVLSDLRISSNPANDILVWPFSAGEFIPYPAEKGEFSIHYPDHAGLPFAILTNGKESFYYACHDKKALMTRFTSAANNASDRITLKICRKHRIPCGTARTDTFVTAALAGTWHQGADLYREFFYSVYPDNSYRPWLRNCDAWLQGSAAGHTGLMKQYRSYSEFHRNFKSAAFLSVDYIQMWGSTFNGACPCYYLPRKDKGGEALFAEEMKFWRDHGGNTGHYYFGNGVSPYYLLTDKYFGLPWSEYPAEYRPPSFDWYVRNREYISDNAAVDEEALRKKTAEINDSHAKGQIVKGNYEESTGYMPMNWRNGEFAAFLKKWVGIYVSKYHCNTAYLDTFAFRNDLADFNPYLKLNGEGDKALFKQQFLEELMTDMRRIEPEFSVLTEGIADIYGKHLYFLLSGFARNPNIYRYTLPDQIIFQGSCNGLWTKPLTRKSILQAFLCGNRYDLVIMFPETYYMLKLRQQISPFLNLATFDDVKGLAVSNPSVTVYAHRILPGRHDRIDGGKTRAVTLTIGNPDGEEADITYALPEDLELKRAAVIEIYHDPRPLNFTRKGRSITFKAPRGSASAVILADSVDGPHRFTATAEQLAPDLIEVKVFNFMDMPREFQVAVGKDQIQPITVQSMDCGALRFPLSAPTAFQILPVIVTAPDGQSLKRIIAGGDTGNRIPIPELPATANASGITRIDFEETIYSTEAAASGRRGLLLEGNGKFKMHKLPLRIVPNAHYELTAQLRKSPQVSMKNGDCFMMVAFYTQKDHKLVRVATMGGQVANDNLFHDIKIEFDTPDNTYQPALYLYNSNSQGKFSVDNVILTEISRSAPPPAEAKETLSHKTTGAPKEVQFDWGETERIDDPALVNKNAVVLTGNGKYCQRKITLALKPNYTYRLKYAIRKGFEVSKRGDHTMVAVCNYTNERKLERYLLSGMSVPGDNRFHLCSDTFKTTDGLSDCGLYIYNINSTDRVTVGDILIEELAP